MRQLLLAAALALAVAPAAAGKEITALQICGASGCADVDVPDGLHESIAAGATTAPPPAGPFVEVAIVYGQHTEQLWYVPAANVFARSDGAGSIQWAEPGPVSRIDELIVAASRRVRPHRPRAVAARVDGQRVRGDAAGYLGLFAVASAGRARMGRGGFERVSVWTEPPSPWADTPLWFYPDEGLLGRGGELIRLPTDVAEDLRAARAVGVRHRGGGFDRPLVAGSVAAAIAVAFAAALARRRPGIATFL